MTESKEMRAMASRTQVRDLKDVERERVRAAFERIEQRLALEDPELVARVQAVPRGEATNAATIFALLVLSVILLTVGLGTQSATALFAGAAAFLVSFGVDRRHRRRTGQLADG